MTLPKNAVAWRDAAVAISFCNLCFLDVWSATANHSATDFLRQPPSPFTLLAAPMSAVAGCAAMVWLVLSWARGLQSERARNAAEWLGGAVFCALPLNIIRTDLLKLTRANALWWAPVALIGLAVGLYYKPRVVLHFPVFVCLVMFPLVPIEIGAFVWSSVDRLDTSAFVDKRPAPVLPSGPEETQIRIVWMVFDEMDECLTFDQRPESVKLTEFDRLRAQSLFADHASPSGPSTLLAMSSIIGGRAVQEVDWKRPDEPLFQYTGGAPSRPLDEGRSVFSQLRAAGADVAVVGWYLPYCRLMGGELSSCFWQPAAFMEEMALPSFWSSVKEALVSRWQRLPLVGAATHSSLQLPADPETRQRVRERSINAYEEIRDHALRVLTDKRFEVVFIHWPLPHLPAIYDRRRAVPSPADHLSYLDNLALADVALGEARRALEKAGQWDRSIVLVTADHALRLQLNRELFFTLEPETDSATRSRQCHTVPFLLKMAGQKTGIDFHGRFNTVKIHDLLLTLLKGQIHTPESAAAWLASQQR